jgi:hypothetical protein
MKSGGNLVFIALFVLFLGCNGNGRSENNADSVKNVLAIDSNVLDTLNFESKVSFTGVVQLSKFGEPGETYATGDTLPNEAYILKLAHPRSFYYQDDMDSMSYPFYKDYDEFQLTSSDTAIGANLPKLVDQQVTLEGNIFQGLTKHYIRDLAISIKKIK